MVKGSDLVSDLLAVLEMIKPFVDVMLQMQPLDYPIGKLKKIYPVFVQKFKQVCTCFVNSRRI